MAILKDPEGLAELRETVARRLKAARKANRLSEKDAAEALGHVNLTQVSLAESGKRIPPLLDLVKYADLYNVPVDFLLGRVNDPLVEGGEHNQSLIARNVGHVISGCFERFAKAVAEQAAICIAGHREDREDLKEAIEEARNAKAALARVRELNPDYEDLRGGSALESSLKRLIDLAERLEERMKREKAEIDAVDKALRLEEVPQKVEQFALMLVP